MQDLYFDGDKARAVLLSIGWRPAAIPVFRAAETFWPEVVVRLENGVVKDGIRKLLIKAATDHPDSQACQDLLAAVGRYSGPVVVLCLLSDPLRDSKIRIDHEARQLEELARLGGIDLRTRHAVRADDIGQAVFQEKPQILHFAGHGLEDGRLVLEDEKGAAVAVGVEGVARVIAAAGTRVLDGVVLNSCFTGRNAGCFRGVTQAVVGSVAAIPDACALAFVRWFYGAIGEGNVVSKAFDRVCAEFVNSSWDEKLLCIETFSTPAA